MIFYAKIDHFFFVVPFVPNPNKEVILESDLQSPQVYTILKSKCALHSELYRKRHDTDVKPLKDIILYTVDIVNRRKP